MKAIISKLRGFYNLAKDMGQKGLLPNWEEQESRISNKEAKAIIDFYEENYWRDVNKKLPEASRDVDFYYSGCLDNGTYSDGVFRDFTGAPVKNVTHWRPITLPN